MNHDLTEGNVTSSLVKFTLPILASMVFQQLYNIADSFVAGKFIGENALAAVGNSYEITLIFIAFAVGANMGSGVLVSQYFGAKRMKEVKMAVSTSYISVLALTVVLTTLGILFSDSFLTLINTPDAIFLDSALYLDIYILGLFFLFFYNIATGIFSALGDSRTPFLFLMFSSLSNIAVDILFVTLFDMGVAGVAWATFLCQGVSSVLANYVLFKRLKELGNLEKVPLFSFSMFSKFVRFAVPSIMQQLFISGGNIIVQARINSFGPAVIAGYSAAIKLNNMVVTSFLTFSNGISSFAAQNVGAGRFDRVREGMKAGVKLSWAICIPVVFIFFFFSDYLLLLFLGDRNSEAFSTATDFLRIVSPFYFVVVVKDVSDAILRGCGAMRPFLYSTFADLFLRVGLSFLFSHLLGSAIGIWLSWPFGWTVGTLISLMFYFKGGWKGTSVVSSST